MVSDWTAINLGKLCTFLAGNAFPKMHQGDIDGDYPFIKVSDMNISGNEKFINTANNWISESTRASIGAKLHPKGSIAFAKIGIALTYNRRRILTQPTILDNNMMSAIPETDNIHPIYFYYLLTTINFNDVVCGTSLPYLRANDLKKIQLQLPPLPEQCAIAQILGSLDDKIELNRRMNQTLEAMAHAIFKSWFVDFDPVHAKIEGRDAGLPEEIADFFPDSFEDSDAGEIPLGWRIGNLGEICNFKGGSVFKKDFQGKSEGDYPFIKVSDMNDLDNERFILSAENYIDDETRLRIKAKLHEKGSVVLAKIGVALTYNRLRILNTSTCIDNNMLSASSKYKEISEALLFMFLSQYDFNFYAKGSALPYLNITDLKKAPVIISSSAIWSLMSRELFPCFETIRNNAKQNQSLSKLRDTLLPKLISGELRVPDAEKFVKEVGL